MDNDFSFAGIGLEDQQIWSAIDECRKLKNDFFASALTDKMKGLIS